MPVRVYGAGGPWYRGGVPRSYVPPSIFASVGCAIYLVFFGIFLIFAGGIMTGVSHQKPDPRFDTEFFRKHRSNGVGDVIGKVGPALLGIGCIILVIAVVLCVVVAFLARKQENKRRNNIQEQAAHPLQPPPASAYPHQPMQQNYPPATSYPNQPVDHKFPGSDYPPQSQYPPQNQYPPQPASYYPPTTTTYSQQYGNTYPSPDYRAPMSDVAPQIPQSAPPGYHTTPYAS